MVDGTSEQESKAVAAAVLGPLTAFMTLLKSNGWPTTLLFMVVIVGWRFTDWAQPQLEEVVKGHSAFLKETADSLKGQVENGKRLADQSAKQTEILDQQRKASDEMAKQIGEVHRKIVKD